MPPTIAQLEAFVSSPHYDAATAGLIARSIPALPRLKGEQIAPGITRIHGNLCNVHGKYGPCDKALSGKKPKKGGTRAARKPRKPIKTPAQRQQERAATHAANTEQVMRSLNIAPDGQQALEALRSGAQPDPKAVERGGFEQAGLVERATDGSYRLSASGRAALSAAAAGDLGRTGDIISGARDRTTARGQRQQATTQRREATAAKRAAADRKRQQAATNKRSMRNKATPTTIYAHGDGGLNSPPGLGGGRRKRKKYTMRTTKAQSDQEKAMFAKMGGGTGGSGGGGGKGGAKGGDAKDKKDDYSGTNTLWPKDPATGRREDPGGLFGRDYHARQTDVQGRAQARDQHRAAQERDREAFFAKQTPTTHTPTPSRVSAPKQSVPTPTTVHTHGTDAPESYRNADQAAVRAKPKGGWADPASEKQRSYAESLNARARANTQEGSDTRALSDEIGKQLPKMNKWEASQIIDAMQHPKPMSTLIRSAKEYIRNGGPEDAPGRALFALPNFRLRLIDTILAEDAKAEELPF